jgi:hypothetical protein
VPVVPPQDYPSKKSAVAKSAELSVREPHRITPDYRDDDPDFGHGSNNAYPVSTQDHYV